MSNQFFDHPILNSPYNYLDRHWELDDTGQPTQKIESKRRHAYFLGANDPYKSLKTTLKAEIDQEAWETLNSDTSRAFAKPKSGRIAVKVINHLGDEVMKVFRV
jgi:hypothetical protein